MARNKCKKPTGGKLWEASPADVLGLEERRSDFPPLVYGHDSRFSERTLTNPPIEVLVTSNQVTTRSLEDRRQAAYMYTILHPHNALTTVCRRTGEVDRKLMCALRNLEVC